MLQCELIEAPRVSSQMAPTEQLAALSFPAGEAMFQSELASGGSGSALAVCPAALPASFMQDMGRKCSSL